MFVGQGCGRELTWGARRATNSTDMDAVVELEIAPGPEPGSYAVHVVRSLAGGEPSATIALDIDDILASSSAARVEHPRIRCLRPSRADRQGVGAPGRSASVSSSRCSPAGSAGCIERASPSHPSVRWVTPAHAPPHGSRARRPAMGGPLRRRGRGIPEPAREPSSAGSPRSTPRDPARRARHCASSASSRRRAASPALDVEAERERLEAALHDHLEQGLVELTWLEDVTWGGLHTKLLREPWHVLHFVGHGGYDPQSG